MQDDTVKRAFDYISQTWLVIEVLLQEKAKEEEISCDWEARHVLSLNDELGCITNLYIKDAEEILEIALYDINSLLIIFRKEPLIKEE